MKLLFLSLILFNPKIVADSFREASQTKAISEQIMHAFVQEAFINGISLQDDLDFLFTIVQKKA